MDAQAARKPHYQHLYEALRQQIIRGDFKAGGLLPSESELQTQYRLTQPTIRQALALLVQDGYIRKHHGKGSIVQPLPIGLGVMSIVGRLANTGTPPDEPGQAAGPLTTAILVKPQLRPFPTDLLFAPADSEAAQFYYLERLRSVDNQRVFYEKLLLPAAYLPGFTRQPLANRSLFDLLRTKYGLTVKGGEQKILAVSADEAVADQLQLLVGNPVLRLDKRIDTNRPEFSFYSSLYAKTDQFLLHGRF
ncbi:GntR family transcriptional regulator [Fibrella sp. HMF5335]|uniref:GntR family transcriptional regulator n=1 Tax=Fibrella rubiginis TaxID=2817060 RepID=A0A939K4W0_9BACT|nr:GntR family transcriptional regulator [Fibrella rubiginis]MBO0935800.1 GntR family transcriptional regulator [Fibrella rubiginis]